MYVYDTDDELFESFTLSHDKLIYHEDKIDLDIGQHLRDNLIDEGSYRVEYNFYRPIAGSIETFYVNENAKIISQEITQRNIGGKPVYSYRLSDGTPVKVDPIEDKYIVSKLLQEDFLLITSSK